MDENVKMLLLVQFPSDHMKFTNYLEETFTKLVLTFLIFGFGLQNIGFKTLFGFRHPISEKNNSFIQSKSQNINSVANTNKTKKTSNAANISPVDTKKLAMNSMPLTNKETKNSTMVATKLNNPSIMDSPNSYNEAVEFLF